MVSVKWGSCVMTGSSSISRYRTVNWKRRTLPPHSKYYSHIISEFKNECLSAINAFFFYRMTRGQRNSVFQYWLSAAEVSDFCLLNNLIIMIYLYFLTCIALHWSDPAMRLSPKSNPLSSTISGLLWAERPRRETCLIECHTWCYSSKVSAFHYNSLIFILCKGKN